MSLERLNLPADRRFWPQAACAVIEFAAVAGLPARRLGGLTWLVPNGRHASLARRALRDRLGALAFIPPRIAPLAAWLGRPLASGTAARAELFSALRANDWVRDALTDQPAALWSLAAAIAQLADQLTWAAIGDAETFAARLDASLARHFRRRAARAIQPQAQLVLQLWHARRTAGDGAAAALRELRLRAAAADTPLVYLAREPLGTGPAGWEQAFVERWAQRAPVLLLAADLRSALTQQPLLAAAWPELAGASENVPIARRADRLRDHSPAPGRPLAIVGVESLEEEATVVARQVLDWRREGVASIALVALDRLTARRVRALLERAQVVALDETGWKLSTTSAAAAVMRWFDLVADDLYWRDLLDWLKSNFTLAGRPNKAREVVIFERAIRAGGALQGVEAMRRALTEFAGDSSDEDTRGAREVLQLIVRQTQATLRAGPTLAAHLRVLAHALDALGVRAGLDTDPVGRAVLREIALLEAEIVGTGGRATLADFRALLAARFEESSYVDAQVDSPVVMASLPATALRHFDAAVLIGADAQHLPAVAPELLFMSNAVCAELGLATADDLLRAQAAQLASLLAGTPRVLATWRTRRGDEPSALSPLLQRLQVVSKRALGDEPPSTAVHAASDVAAVAATRPAPAAADLLPDRISASQAQSLVDCAYRFYARSLLRLEEPEDVIEMPDKRDFGEALHRVLRRFHGEWGGAAFDSIDADALAASLRRHAGAVFDPLIERSPAMLAYHRRFDGLVDGYIGWLQRHAADGWRWTAGEDKRVQRIALRDGREIELVGRVDRIDEHRDGRVRVLDYKARPVDKLRAALKEPGEDIQLPFYGLLLAHRAESAAYVSFDRVRDDKRGVEAVVPPQPFAALVESVAARLQGDLQRIADRAPLPAIGAEAACEHCEMRGLCRRDYWQHGTDDPVGEGAPR